ncbi:MAG: ATP-binding protein [Bacteroidaceae bacterium]
MNTDNLTLARAFETVATKLEGSGLTSQAFVEVTDATSYIGTKLKVNPYQAFILATMLHNVGRTMETKEFADFASVSPIRMMALQKDFDCLMNKGLIVCVKPMSYNYWQQTFTLSAGIIQAVKYNRKYKPVSYKDLTEQDVLDMIEKLLQDCDYSRISYYQMVEHLDKLIADAQHLGFCKKVKELEMSQADLVLFLIGVVCLVSKSEDLVTTSDYDDILPGIYQRQMVRQFKNRQHLLCINNLMEATDDDFDTFRLTKKARNEYLKDFGIEEKEDLSIDSSVSSPTEEDKKCVIEKKLFYNPAETEHIERLKSLLSQEKFEEVKNRMRAVGMRPGFACLFYGGPGTGKTETVLQLARTTGREIVQVNVANLRNMYVGESEKNTQQVFDDYKMKLEESDVTPILLFNEADGIFGNRYTGINDAVNQMENTIQNIILQNMETFEGILIATTNLTDNFDKAFERRFLFKIYFEKPKADVRKQIWMSVLPKLSSDDATILATSYDFTGSMIENVARRQTIDEILYDRPMTLDTIKRLCDEELIKKPLGIKKWSA